MKHDLVVREEEKRMSTAVLDRCLPAPDAAFVASPRKLYYNPKLDPHVQAVKMTPEMRKAVNDGDYDDGSVQQGGPLHDPNEGHSYNLVSSLCDDGLHRPALDVDAPSGALLSLLADRYGPLVVVGSSNPEHLHVYAPLIAFDWETYQIELQVLTELGAIDDKYRLASVARGQTLLRPPHVKKVAS